MRVENEKRIFEISVLFNLRLANEKIQQKTKQELLKIPKGAKEQKFQNKFRRSLVYIFIHLLEYNCNHNNFY